MTKTLLLTVGLLALFHSGARFASANPAEPLGPCSRRTGLVISEIMYHPLKPAPPLKEASYIELYNSSAFTEDISGFWLVGSVTNQFSPGTLLPAHSFLVVAQDTNTIMTLYGL